MSLSTLRRRIDRIAASVATDGNLSLHDKEILRKRQERSEAARIIIPEIVDIKRRERCLDDPELFMRTYFGGPYRLGFASDHRFIVSQMVDIASQGGRQAVAASRGRGKSETVKGMLVYVVAKELVRFPLPVAATTTLAFRLFDDFRRKIASSDELLEDFPEICWPVRCLDGAPQRSKKQHVNGKPTKIVWTNDYISLPHVPGSPYGGVKMAYFGLDAAFRGVNIGGDRPDFVVIDDPETRESAKSFMQIDDREQIIDRDIAGLEAQDKTMGILCITTVQNSYCLSAKLTDRERKPAWNGVRFRLIEKWPDDMEAWNEYIAKRNSGQASGDRFASEATAYYLANRTAMDAGAVLISDHFKPVFNKSGQPTVFSALQQAFNKIADTDLESFKTEYQNDPAKEEEAETSQLKAGRVIIQLSGEQQARTPDAAEFTFIGMDIGKFRSKWVKIACNLDGVFWITDYGTEYTSGLSKQSNKQNIERAILRMLEEFAESDPCTIDPPLLALIDSGWCTNAVYEFAITSDGPFYASKGVDPGRYVAKKESAEYTPFLEAHAHLIKDECGRDLSLYVVNGEYWKEWGQERFLVDPFIDSTRVPGSIALFDPPGGDAKFHLPFARSMVSESAEWVPIDKKVNKKVWVVHDKRNNHDLDAYALACAAAGCAGVRLLPNVELPKPLPQQQPKQAMTTPHGKPFLVTER